MRVLDGGPQAGAADQGRDTVKDFFDRVWRRIQDALRAAGWTAQAMLGAASGRPVEFEVHDRNEIAN